MIYHVVEQSEFLARRNELKPKFALLDGVSSANEMFNKVMVSPYIVYATDNDLVVGTYCYGAVQDDYPCMCPELLELISPSDVLAFPNNIYVRPEYRGSNLVSSLQLAYTQDAIRRGFTHSVGYLPQTEDIKAWAEAQTNLTVIRPSSAQIDWITLRTLS